MHVHAGDLRNAKTSRVLRISLAVTLAYIVLLVSLISSHSLALLSEAGHNLTDFLRSAYVLGGGLLRAGHRVSAKTFGYNRAGCAGRFGQRSNASS